MGNQSNKKWTTMLLLTLLTTTIQTKHDSDIIKQNTKETIKHDRTNEYGKTNIVQNNLTTSTKNTASLQTTIIEQVQLLPTDVTNIQTNKAKESRKLQINNLKLNNTSESFVNYQFNYADKRYNEREIIDARWYRDLHTNKDDNVNNKQITETGILKKLKTNTEDYDDEDEVLIETEEESDIKQQREIDDAVEFGLKEMKELIDVKEPMWYRMGLYLDKNDPATHVANFGKPNDKTLKLAKFGYAALEASKKIAESYSEKAGRQSAGLPDGVKSRLLLDDCPLKGFPRCTTASRRYRTSDGTCNNPKNPWRGSAMLPMQRFLPPTYEDGIQSVRRSIFGSRLPSARDVSTRIHRDRNHEISTVTLMFMQWGQFLDHDIVSVAKSRAFNGTVPRCCQGGGREFLPPDLTHPTCLPISVADDDWFFARFGIRCLEFIRSAPSTRIDCDLGWREQINQVTSYVDASAVYGSDLESSDFLRSFRGGKLQYGRPRNQGPLRPPDPPGGELCRSGAISSDCFEGGDGRFNEQSGLTAIHTIWLRYHNRIATILEKVNPQWSDEKLYQESRKIISALIQHITYREFLPIVLGQEVMELFELNSLRKGFYEDYDSRVNPAISNAFGAAAFRFGHSMVPNSYVRHDSKHRPLNNNVSLHREQENIENIWSFGSIDRLILGLVNQPSQRRDEFISEELTNHLFQSPGLPFGMDLAAINIQRGRDHGIPPYTSWRHPCGLSPIKDWKDLQSVLSFETAQRLRSLYEHVDDIDLFSGGLSEKPVRGGIVGPTFACIIAQQFLNLRKGDRFWYENGGFDSSFTPAQLQEIRHVTLSSVLCQTLDEIETVQPFVFLSADNFRNIRLDCGNPAINNFDFTPWAEKDFNEIDSKLDFDRFKSDELSIDINDTFVNEGRSSSKKRKKPNKKRRQTNKITTTTTRTTTIKRNKKATTKPTITIKITNVTSETVPLPIQNKYGPQNNNYNEIPSRPTFGHGNFVQNDRPSQITRPLTYQQNSKRPTHYNYPEPVTYLVNLVERTTTPAPKENPLEVNIKIQYVLPESTSSVKPQTFSTNTNKRPKPNKRKGTTKKPTTVVSYPIFIKDQETVNYVSTKRPSNNYFNVLQSSKPDKLTDVFTISRPVSNNYNQDVQYNSNKRPTNVYNIDRPNDNGYQPQHSIIIKRPPTSTFNQQYPTSNIDYNNKRPIHSNIENFDNDGSYNGPGFYNFGDTTTKKIYIIRPPSYYDSTIHNVYPIYENQPFSTSPRPHIYKPDSNHYLYSTTYRPTRPEHQQSYYDQSNYYSKDKYQQNSNYGDRNDGSLTEIIVKNDKFSSDIPKKPTFGLVNDHINKPVKIYSIGHVDKIPNDNIHDKLDFKTRFVTHKRGSNHETPNGGDKFLKVSSVKAGTIIEDGQSELHFHIAQREGDDLDLSTELKSKPQIETFNTRKIKVVDIDVMPSEIRNHQWVFYNTSNEELMPLLIVPDINSNISCSNELPKPMNISMNLKGKDKKLTASDVIDKVKLVLTLP